MTKIGNLRTNQTGDNTEPMMSNFNSLQHLAACAEVFYDCMKVLKHLENSRYQ